MLTRTKMLMVAGLSLAALTPTIASAHSNLSIGVNLGGYGYAPVYVAPQPVYVQPEPTVVYEQAPTVIYGPTVVYGQPYWDGYRWCRGGERRHHEWRGRGRDEGDDD